MDQDGIFNSARAAAVLSLGLLMSTSRAFVPPTALVALRSNVFRQQQQEQRCTGNRQLYCSSTHKPSLKPSWKSPRWKESSSRSVTVQASPAAIDVPGNGATYSASTTEPSQRVPQTGSSSKSYGKPTWKSAKTPSRLEDSSSGNNGSSNDTGKSPSSPSSPVLESFSDASPTENAPSTYSAGTTGTTTSSPEEAAEAVSEGSYYVPAATDSPPQPAAEPAAEPAASAPPASPLPFKAPPSKRKSAMDDVGVTLRRAKEALAPFRKKLQDNIAEGNVGERGEEWAVAQAVILLCIALGTVPVIGGLVVLLAGPGLVVGGVAVGAAGVTGLGQSLSPWPAPVADNELKTDGIYGIIRHPTYTGLVMACLGFGVATGSPLRMLLAALLALVLDRKSEREEGMLVGLHGEAYEIYRATVAKFVPGFY